jgi:hypothetical protein
MIKTCDPVTSSHVDRNMVSPLPEHGGNIFLSTWSPTHLATHSHDPENNMNHQWHKNIKKTAIYELLQLTRSTS